MEDKMIESGTLDSRDFDAEVKEIIELVTERRYSKVRSMLLEKNAVDVAEILEVHSVFDNVRSLVFGFMEKVKSVPLVSLILTPGFYTYVLVIAFGYLFCRRKTGMILFPIVLILAIACLSPINAYMRYFLPVATLAPFCFGVCFVRDANTEA